MKKIKRVLAVLLALILALGAVASLAETLPTAVPLTAAAPGTRLLLVTL